jgi:hypothetical protein
MGKQLLKFFLKYKERIVIVCIYLLVFLYSVYPASDKDWGWHYRYGEYFFKNWSILREDIYSWTLPGYQWVNHSWAYDIFLYIVTNTTGFIGLSLSGAFFAALAFYFTIKNFKLPFWKTAILAIIYTYLSQISLEGGLRSQVVSLTLFAVLMWILAKYKNEPKKLYRLVPLFLLWVNVHADFVFGLIIFLIFIGSFSLHKYFKKGGDIYHIFGEYLKPVLASIAVTFINPFTYLIYTESPRHLSNSYLKNILEWDPIFNSCDSCHPYFFLFYCGILILLFIRAFRKKDIGTLPYTILAVCFFFPTYTTRRFLPVFGVITLPVVAMYLEELKLKLEKYKITFLLCMVSSIILLEYNLYNRFTSMHLYHYTEEDYCMYNSSCSIKTAEYLIKHPPEGHGFNFYDWGGYYIGKGIPAKLFIDGRMHVWSKDGYQPFGDYIEMYYNGNYELFSRYNFDWLLLPNDSNISQRLMTTQDLGIWKLEFQDGVTNYFVRQRLDDHEK